MLRGDLYDAGDPELVAARERARNLTSEYNRTSVTDRDRRDEILRELLRSRGEGCVIEPAFRCNYGENISVGEGFYANFDCTILDVCQVEFGDHCLLGPSVHVYTATHPLSAPQRNEGHEYGKPVSVGESVWIGGQAVINPGVTIGDEAVIGAGAVVTEDVPSGVVVQGNPATVVKQLE